MGVHHFIQKVTRDIFYFDFQMSGLGADDTAVERFLQRDSPRFAFGGAYVRPGREARNPTLDQLLPWDGPTDGLVVRGGTAHVTGSAFPTPLALTSDTPLPSTGRVRLIVRIFVPGSGGPRPTRDVEHYKLGSVGIIRTGQVPSESAPLAPPVQWVVKSDLVENWLKEDVVAGVDYDAGAGTLVVHSNSHTSRLSRFQAHTTQVDASAPGELYLAAQLLPKAAGTVQSILSVREVDDDAEWTKFLDHVALEGTHLVRPVPAAAAAGPAPGPPPVQPRGLYAARAQAAAPPQALAAGDGANNMNQAAAADPPPAARRNAGRAAARLREPLRRGGGAVRSAGAALAGRLFPGRNGGGGAAREEGQAPAAALADAPIDDVDEDPADALMAHLAREEDEMAAEMDAVDAFGDGEEMIVGPGGEEEISLAAAMEQGMRGDELDAETLAAIL